MQVAVFTLQRARNALVGGGGAGGGTLRKFWQLRRWLDWWLLMASSLRRAHPHHSSPIPLSLSPHHPPALPAGACCWNAGGRRRMRCCASRERRPPRRATSTSWPALARWQTQPLLKGPRAASARRRPSPRPPRRRLCRRPEGMLTREARGAAAAASAASGQCVLARSSLSWPSLHNRPAEFYLNTSPTLVIRTPGPRWKGHECPMPTAKCCICPLLRPESKAFWPSTPATRKTLGSVSSSPLGPTPAWAFVLWRFRPASCLTVARS
jgi:hypothetical protein